MKLVVGGKVVNRAGPAYVGGGRSPEGRVLLQKPP